MTEVNEDLKKGFHEAVRKHFNLSESDADKLHSLVSIKLEGLIPNSSHSGVIGLLSSKTGAKLAKKMNEFKANKNDNGFTAAVGAFDKLTENADHYGWMINEYKG